MFSHSINSLDTISNTLHYFSLRVKGCWGVNECTGCRGWTGGWWQGSIPYAESSVKANVGKLSFSKATLMSGKFDKGDEG